MIALLFVAALAQDTCAVRSSDILALLPDDEEKREFILDCTGCHQLGEPHARPAGQWRTEAQWVEAIARMLAAALWARLDVRSPDA